MKKRTAPMHAPISLALDQLAAVHGGDEEPAALTLKLAPEYTRFKKASG
jgi:hypothetical protein